MSEETVFDAPSSEPTTAVAESSAPAPSQSPDATPSAGGENIWSSFRALPDFQGQDDTQIAGRLYASLEREKAATKALQQYQQLIPYAQEYLTHRPAFEQWRQQSSAPQPAPQEAPPTEQHKWWNPPQLKDSDRRYLTKDTGGRDSIAEDAPLHVRDRLLEYMQYRSDFAQKFLTDPQAALGPMVEQVAADRAREIVQEQIREVSEASYVSTLEQQNRDWLYEKDGSTPTREGLMIQKYINQAAQYGHSTPNDRWQFACDMVERDLLREVVEQRQSRAAAPAFLEAPPASAPVPQAAPAENRAERDIEYLRREASRNPSRSGQSSDPRIPKAPMTFEQRLRAQMARDGIE